MSSSRHMQNYAQPLFKLLCKTSEFTQAQDCELPKLMLINSPVLRRLNSSLTYILHTNWSNLVCVTLPQIIQGCKEHPVADSYHNARCRADICPYPKKVSGSGCSTFATFCM